MYANRFANMMLPTANINYSPQIPLINMIPIIPIKGTASTSAELEEKIKTHIENKIKSLSLGTAPTVDMNKIKGEIISTLRTELQQFIKDNCEIKGSVTSKAELNNMITAKLTEELNKLNITNTIETLKIKIGEIEASSKSNEDKINKLQRLEEKVDKIINEDIKILRELINDLTTKLPDMTLLTNKLSDMELVQKKTEGTLADKIKKLDTLETLINTTKVELTDYINKQISELNITFGSKVDLKVAEYNKAFENVYDELKKLTKMINKNESDLLSLPKIVAYIEDVKEELKASILSEFKNLFDKEYSDRITQFTKLVNDIIGSNTTITSLTERFGRFEKDFKLEDFTNAISKYKQEIDEQNRLIIEKFSSYTLNEETNRKLEELKKLLQSDEWFNITVNQRKGQLTREIKEYVDAEIFGLRNNDIPNARKNAVKDITTGVIPELDRQLGDIRTRLTNTNNSVTDENTIRKKAINEIKAELANIKGRLDQTSSKNEYNSLLQKSNQLEQQLSKMDNMHMSEINKLVALNNQLQTKVDGLISNITNITEDNNLRNKTINQLEQKLEQLNTTHMTEINKLNELNGKLQKNIDELMALITNITEQMKQASTKEQYDDLLNKYNKLSVSITDLSSKLTQNKQQVAQMNKIYGEEFNRFKTKFSQEITGQIVELTKTLQYLNEQFELLQTQMTVFKDTNDDRYKASKDSLLKLLSIAKDNIQTQINDIQKNINKQRDEQIKQLESKFSNNPEVLAARRKILYEDINKQRARETYDLSQEINKYNELIKNLTNAL